MERNKILYAEDNDYMRNLIIEFLEKFEDYNIESFLEGTSFKNRLEKDVSDVALVITDNQMPGYDGFSIIKDYSRKKKFEKIPFILCYGGHESIGKEAKKRGAFDYIQKPFTFSQFTEVLQKALNFSEK